MNPFMHSYPHASVVCRGGLRTTFHRSRQPGSVAETDVLRQRKRWNSTGWIAVDEVNPGEDLTTDPLPKLYP